MFSNKWVEIKPSAGLTVSPLYLVRKVIFLEKLIEKFRKLIVIFPILHH